MYSKEIRQALEKGFLNHNNQAKIPDTQLIEAMAIEIETLINQIVPPINIGDAEAQVLGHAVNDLVNTSLEGKV